jgi:replication factor A1
MTDLADQLEQVKAAFEDDDIEVDEDEALDRLETLISEYSVPEKEARRSVIRKIGEEHGLDPLGSDSDGPSGGSTKKDVADIERSGQWLTVEVQMVNNWDANHQSIAQTGLVADPTGTIKFTSWEDANKPELVEGESYRLENVVTDSYQGRLSIQLQESSEVVELDEDIEAGEETETQTGVIVDTNNGSGLVKRCPKDDCTRVVQNDRCNEHGEVDGDFDLRLKAVLDNGQSVQSVIFNREATEEVTGIDLAEAKEMAQKALDTEVVIGEMKPEVVNRYYEIEGPKYGEYLMAQEFEVLGGASDEQVEALLERI